MRNWAITTWAVPGWYDCPERLLGPRAWNLDTSVGKKFKLTERFRPGVRAEGFNIFNHHNMYTFTPDLDYFPATTTPLEVTGLKGGLNNFATGAIMTNAGSDSSRCGRDLLKSRPIGAVIGAERLPPFFATSGKR